MTLAEQQIFLIENLRDLHQPTVNLWWPLADGWWITGGIAAAVLLWALYGLYKRTIQSLLTRNTLTFEAQLSSCYEEWQSSGDNAAYVHCVSLHLRKAAIASAGRSAVAKLNGTAWVQWLELASDQIFSADTKLLLSHGPYQLAPSPPSMHIHKEVSDCLIKLSRLRITPTPSINQRITDNA